MPGLPITCDDSMSDLRLLYQDDHLVVVTKPADVLVHRSALDRHAPRILMTELRDRLGRYVYPVHRLDRPTSGVMVFALGPAVARQLSEAFRQHQVVKHYLAVVRGFAPLTRVIDRPLREEDGHLPKALSPAMPATTTISRLATTELPVALDRYPTSRYSLVAAQPATGRRHQIRRHLSGAGYPIIGDAKHGKGVHNRYFKQHYFPRAEGDARLLLAATALEFVHPVLGCHMHLTAALEDDMGQLFHHFDWQSFLPVDHVSLV